MTSDATQYDVEWECGDCGKAMTSYDEIGYDGPAGRDGRPDPRNDTCSPTMPWLVLCTVCASRELEAQSP
jgi:hypothetical protein